MTRPHGQFIVFALVGATSAFVYFALFWILYDVLEFSFYLSFGVAYALALLIHFSANRYFTFASLATAVSTQLMRYVGLLLANYVITAAIGIMAVDLLHASPYVGVSIAIAFTMGFNFLLSKLWVFAPKRN